MAVTRDLDKHAAIARAAGNRRWYTIERPCGDSTAVQAAAAELQDITRTLDVERPRSAP